jgi:hypothetical protein
MPVVDDAFLSMVDAIRKIPGPTIFNIRNSTLSILQRVWFGGQPGAEGGFRDTTTIEPVAYKIVPITTQQVMGSGGQYEVGDIKVGAITPAYNNKGIIGGLSEAALHPVTNLDNTETVYKISGNHDGEYQFVAVESWKRMSFWLVLRRRVTTPYEP